MLDALGPDRGGELGVPADNELPCCCYLGGRPLESQASDGSTMALTENVALPVLSRPEKSGCAHPFTLSCLVATSVAACFKDSGVVVMRSVEAAPRTMSGATER